VIWSVLNWVAGNVRRDLDYGEDSELWWIVTSGRDEKKPARNAPLFWPGGWTPPVKASPDNLKSSPTLKELNP
jgi:hypothetical protein